MTALPSEERQKLLVLLLVGLLYSVGIAWFFASLPSNKLTSDFFPRWHASRTLLTEGRSIYDWANAAEISAVTGWPQLHQLGYYYPAYLLIFTAPLALLPYHTAYVIWVVLGLWCLWLSLVIFARLLDPQPSINQLTVLLILVSTTVPVFQHTQYAQFNSLGALALALSYWALHQHKYFWAGIAAGGLLFKPQATLVTLLLLVLWTALKRERWRFWGGLGAVSLLLWAAAELLEPNWVVSFLGTLSRYEPIQSVIQLALGDPFRLFSLSLLAGTVWLIWRVRAVEAGQPAFYGLLAWTVCLNALIVPMYGMLHIVLLGPVLVILWAGLSARFPAANRWLWAVILLLFGAGWVAFVGPLAAAGRPGLHIFMAELVYRFTMPALFGAAALWLTFDALAGPQSRAIASNQEMETVS